jgi:hypothetical protein
MNGDNLNNVRSEASEHYGNKNREYLKDKVYELVIHKAKTFQAYTEEYMNFKRVVNLELTR